MDRRNFLKASCTFCVLAGAGAEVVGLSGCSPLPLYRAEVEDGLISMPRALFSTHPLQIVRAEQLEYDIAVRKAASSTFTAFVLRCTHADTQLDVSDDGYSCPLHGSRFDAGGKVTRGPAAAPLETLPVRESGERVLILVNQRAGRAGNKS